MGHIDSSLIPYTGNKTLSAFFIVYKPSSRCTYIISSSEFSLMMSSSTYAKFSLESTVSPSAMSGGSAVSSQETGATIPEGASVCVLVGGDLHTVDKEWCQLKAKIKKRGCTNYVSSHEKRVLDHRTDMTTRVLGVDDETCCQKTQ